MNCFTMPRTARGVSLYFVTFNILYFPPFLKWYDQSSAKLKQYSYMELKIWQDFEFTLPFMISVKINMKTSQKSPDTIQKWAEWFQRPVKNDLIKLTLI